MKKTLLSLFLIFGVAAITASSLFAVDFSVRINPGLAIPLKEHYKPALNVGVQGDIQLFDWVTLGGEGNILYETPEGASSSVNFLYGGLGLGVYHNIFSRMYFGVGGAAGFYNYSFPTGNEKQSAVDLYWRGYGELGFRFNPTMTMSLNGGYNSFLTEGQKL